MRKPYATVLLILLAISSYLVMSEGKPYITPEDKMYEFGVSRYNALTGNIKTFVTYAFMHVGLKHVTINMLVLIAIGTIVENKIKWKHTLALFFFSSITAGIAYAATVELAWVIGASGGIAGLMVAAYLADFKKTIIALLVITITVTFIALPLTDMLFEGLTETNEKIVNESQEKIEELNETIEEVQKEIEEKTEKGENTTQEKKIVQNLTSQLNKTKTIQETAKKEKEEIETSKEEEENTPPSNLLHTYGALAGVAYMMLFKREAFEWFMKDVKKMGNKIRKRINK